MITGRVLVLNCGSSSIKYQLVDVADGRALAKGLAERIGEPDGHLRHQGTDSEVVRDDPIPDHVSAMRAILAGFEEAGPELARSDLAAVGHRVVHGGERFTNPTLIDDGVVDAVDDLATLAPLHNPANATGIRVARKVLPDLPHVAVFDTAFHHSLPPHASTYAVPPAWRADHGVRRYGFHGTSVAHVTREACQMLGGEVDDCNLIVLHLGNGASASAIAGGRSIDTSMGLTPLEGLVMGTRSGDVDPAIIAYLHRVADVSAQDVDDQLNRESGLLGLAGANDMREVHRRADAGSQDAQLALDVYCYRLRKYVGAYYAALGRVNAIVFTAGIGENDAEVRARSLAGLERLGVVIDPARNASPRRDARSISPDGTDLAVLVVPTNEELEIARQALAVARA